MFGFRIRYLRGVVTAAHVSRGSEKDEVEWPPHPDRLFCALVQAWADNGLVDTERAALEWLEGLGPPWLRCGELVSHRATRHQVPVNDNVKQSGGSQRFPLIQGTLLARDRKPRQFAVGTLSEDVVEMWWPEAKPAPQIVEALGRLARSVTYLGHSSSLVAVDLLSQPGGWAPNLVAHPEGTLALRVPYRGRLTELIAAFAQDLRPPLGEWVLYGPPSVAREPEGGHHRELIVFRMASDRAALPIEATVRVTHVWRRALIALADQPVSEVISGHSPESTLDDPRPLPGPHLALLPLADVGHPFARGHLLGLAAALPAGLKPSDRLACLRALGRVSELALGPLGLWRLERCDASERRRVLLPETWRRPSRVWSSVTPVVFGKYPSSFWSEEAHAFIREACVIAGLPEPVEVALAPVAWVLGVPPAFRFPPLPSRPGKPRRPHIHVLVKFDRPVAGPVLIGAGRHLGYGLCRQLEGVEG